MEEYRANVKMEREEVMEMEGLSVKAREDELLRIEEKEKELETIPYEED